MLNNDRKVRIGFLTSGGDAPGMNAAIRAIVRMAIYRDCEPFAIYEGFRGLLIGGNMIVPFGWNDVAHIIGEGGTILKSSRCPEFMLKDNRKKAALNLVEKGIDKLIVIGGDGSLTGADTLRQEWPILIEELVQEGLLDREMAHKYGNLMIVGLAGSIDNDMVGTEVTIGANSSLHRVIEAVDCIHSTASSHQRAFIIEVMGRHCGWLALNAAISAAADWLIIPEDPPTDGWEARMCRSIQKHRKVGRSVTIIIIAEGAVDRQNQPIRSEYVKDILTEHGLDARVTTLGHIQRGGSASAFDRYLGTMQGIKAVETILGRNAQSSPSILVGMNENQMTCRPLVECVTKTRAVAKSMADLQFEETLKLRDADFRSNYEIWKVFMKASDGQLQTCVKDLTIAIVNCGAPCGGMNAAVASACYYSLSRGFKFYGIFNGFEGLIKKDYRPLLAADMIGLVGKGGSFLGTNRSLPSGNFEAISDALEEINCGGLVIVGGFEAFVAVKQMVRVRDRFKPFQIPMVCIPATISNNVPGTEYSIGSDTALNTIVQSCDCIKQSASSSQDRVFVVEVQGGHCGYLAMMGALSSGACMPYIPEKTLSLKDLQRDAKHLRERFTDDRRQGRLLVKNEKCSDIYTAELVSKILEAESEGIFDSRWVVLGHLQQGGPPSPLDRVRAVRLAVLAIRHIEFVISGNAFSPTMIASSLADGIEPSTFTENHDFYDEECSSSDGDSTIIDSVDAIVIGIKGPKVRFSPVLKLEKVTDHIYRRPKNQWWMGLSRYSRILAKYPLEDDQ